MAADTTTSSSESFFIGGIADADDSILLPGTQPGSVDISDGGGQSIDDQNISINQCSDLGSPYIHRRGMAASVCSLTPVPAFENNHMPGGL